MQNTTIKTQTDFTDVTDQVNDIFITEVTRHIQLKTTTTTVITLMTEVIVITTMTTTVRMTINEVTPYKTEIVEIFIIHTTEVIISPIR